MTVKLLTPAQLLKRFVDSDTVDSPAVRETLRRHGLLSKAFTLRAMREYQEQRRATGVRSWR